MAFVSNKLDPLFESNDLKANGTGVYQKVFDTVDYDNKSGADVVDILLDGMDAVGYPSSSAPHAAVGSELRYNLRHPSILFGTLVGHRRPRGGCPLFCKKKMSKL